MVELLDDRAWSIKGAIERYEALNPNDPLPPSHHWCRQYRAYNAAARILTIMASYEDRSREFVSQLLKDYAEGRWP